MKARPTKSYSFNLTCNTSPLDVILDALLGLYVSDAYFHIRYETNVYSAGINVWYISNDVFDGMLIMQTYLLLMHWDR